jgi:hypothetical protein
LRATPGCSQLGIVNIPVMVAAGWTEAQKRAYVLADNQLAITGSGWDPELLRPRFRVASIRCTQLVMPLLTRWPNLNPKLCPCLLKASSHRCRLHLSLPADRIEPSIRLELGDCLEVILRLVAEGVVVDAVVTDPPYGLEFMGKSWDAPWGKRSGIGGTSSVGFSDPVAVNLEPPIGAVPLAPRPI